MKIAEFIKSAGISMIAAKENLDMDMVSRYPTDHWRCKFRAGRSSMTIRFIMPKGHEPPAAADVLDWLAIRAADYENANGFQRYHDWCFEYGYDTYSPKAELVFKVVKRQTNQLRRFLGESAYKTLLWDTERMTVEASPFYESMAELRPARRRIQMPNLRRARRGTTDYQ